MREVERAPLPHPGLAVKQSASSSGGAIKTKRKAEPGFLRKSEGSISQPLSDLCYKEGWGTQGRKMKNLPDKNSIKDERER